MGDDGLDELVAVLDRLADRFRAMAQSHLLLAVPGHPSRAAAGLELARQLATWAQRVEEGPAARPREIPDAGVFAVGDQLSVAGHDLVIALAQAPDAAPGLLGEAVAAVRTTAKLTG
ncbi:hypothetical protein OG455_16405 [Kitasatospora sp. NBC_01287]|uniref:hypothetical protein n=1 Tax=Kitasatospora sp. NBC_01287 TaxID=2903573 RepID=UPI00225847C3|nr:hypothetical protein [Kitasatospora sp. NBC_01287]MCX4747086.1 hypothetical protein [Kitasatospora sp. NBC_01287]